MTKILLVEDDKSLREIYGVRLLAEGYDIVSAGDGEEALAMAIKERPHLIVSDVMMPKISGFDMLDILRSTTETKDIKVIMMTALSSEDQRLRGEQLGADRYLVKSQVGIEDVVRTVHDVLGDAPVSMTAQQTFSQPSQANAPRPMSVPPREEQPQQPLTAPPQPQSAPEQPQQQSPQPAPAFTMPTPAEQPSTLPQPTAPFSSQRPANLADRVIHPLESNTQAGPDVSTLIDNELNGSPLPPPPVAPTSAPDYTTPPPAFASQPQQQASEQPQQQSAPQPAPFTPPSYEETPRQDSPAQSFDDSQQQR